jgi:hypothetical protein
MTPVIAPRARRGTRLPASHRYCLSASKGPCGAIDDAKNTLSTPDAVAKSRSRSSIRRQLPRSKQPQR